MSSTFLLNLFLLVLLVITSACVEKPSTEGQVTQSSGTSANGVELKRLPRPFRITSSAEGNAQVSITYGESEEAESYYVQYRPLDSLVFLNEASTASPHILSGLTNGVSYAIKVTAINSEGTIDSNTVVLTPVTTTATAPVSKNLSVAGTEDKESIITLKYVDANGDIASSCSSITVSNLSVTKNCECASGVCTIGVTGDLNFTGAASFTYRVTANAQLSNTATVSVTISAADDPPVAVDVPDTDTPMTEDTEATVTLTYFDNEGDDAVTCSVSSLNKVSVTSACACTTGICKVKVKGVSNYSGAAGFNFTVTANSKLSNQGTVDLLIAASDDAPVAQAMIPSSFNEDTQSIITFSYTDTEGDAATACALSSLSHVTETQPCACALGVCTVGVTGTANYFGAGSFNYTVTANGQTSAAAKVVFTIDGVDDAPVAANLTPTPNLKEDAQTIIALSYSDPEGNVATACAISLPSNVTETSACKCNAGACYVGVTSTADYSGAGGFSYTVTANGLTSVAATATFTIDAMDDAPVATGVLGVTTFDEDTVSAAITLPYTDPDGAEKATACALSSLTKVVVDPSGPCTCNGAGTCTVKVKGFGEYNGAASFKYTVTVNNKVSNQGSATLSITSIDDAPVAVAQTARAIEDTEKFIVLTYRDPEGDSASSCTISAETDLTVTTPCICLFGACGVGVTGTANFTGPASFKFTVTTGTGPMTSGTAKVDVNIVSQDDPPKATDAIVHLYHDEEVEFTLPYTDSDSDVATACSVSVNSNATVVTPCACDAFGVCKVKLKGAIKSTTDIVYYGTFNVTTAGVTSNNANIRWNCPVGYVKIKGNPNWNANDFCVMQYEAKIDTGVAISHYTGAPQTLVSMSTATDYCRNLDTAGKFDLISNREWMTIARDAEAEETNWITASHTNATYGSYTKCLKKGNQGYTEPCGYDGANPESGTGRNTLAKLVMDSNGSEIWDFAGNVDEWVLWETNRSRTVVQMVTAMRSSYYYNCGTGGAQEIWQLTTNCMSMPRADYLQANTSYYARHGIGRFIDGSPWGLSRGGNFSSGYLNGIFNFNFARTYTYTYSDTGFRCVFRP